MGTCVSAVQHLRRMRGGSQSHLLRASDGAHYVTKFMNNPQHVRVLANEMLATNLGLRLGLPMPRVEVIDVSDQLIENTDDLRVEVAAQVPEEWYEYDVSGMNRLIEMLYRRRPSIRDLISEFRKSKRNPFPNCAES